MEIIETDKAPAAVGPYSQAVACGEFLFLSGKSGRNACIPAKSMRNID